MAVNVEFNADTRMTGSLACDLGVNALFQQVGEMGVAQTVERSPTMGLS